MGILEYAEKSWLKQVELLVAGSGQTLPADFKYIMEAGLWHR